MCVFSWRRAGGVGGTWGIRVSFAGNVKEAHQRLRSSAAATRVVVCVYDGSLARRAAAAPRRSSALDLRLDGGRRVCACLLLRGRENCRGH